MIKRPLFFIAGTFFFFLSADPSRADRQLLTDSELDRIAAAGETKRNSEKDLQVGKTAAARLDVQPHSQSNARALTVNNVAGHNLIANGININSGAARPRIGR